MVTIIAITNKYCYGYSQFCEYLLRHRRQDQAVMHFTHRPGKQLQVDFAGGKLSYVDRHTGEIIPCEVVICALPYSLVTRAVWRRP